MTIGCVSDIINNFKKYAKEKKKIWIKASCLGNYTLRYR